jgi:hypothetical protein
MGREKTHQGKNERFFATKCQKTPMERKIAKQHDFAVANLTVHSQSGRGAAFIFNGGIHR